MIFAVWDLHMDQLLIYTPPPPKKKYFVICFVHKIKFKNRIFGWSQKVMWLRNNV